MQILGIESAALTASVAVVTEEYVLAEYTVNYKKTHSQTLLPMIDEIVKMVELDLHEIDAIAVSGGPGSFTGLRIGSATAKGLGLALNKPLIHVPTVDAMAYQAYGCQMLICPVMDARRNQVYTGLYEFREGLFQIIKSQQPMDFDELLEELKEKNRDVLFLGEGVSVYKERIRKELSSLAFFAPPYLSRQRAAAVASLGLLYFQEGKIESAAAHKPDYMRPSQAERVRRETCKSKS